MMEDASRGILGLFLWSFVPNLLTNVLLKQFYRLKYSDQSLKPKKGSPKFRKHYLLAFFAVMSIYFAYCIGQAIYDIPENFYKRIGINRVMVDEELKQKFRSLVLQHHPDKNPGADPEKFLEIKHIYEVLSDANTRCGYEVYGNSVFNSASSSSKTNKGSKISMRDLAEISVLNWGIFYLSSLLVLLLMTIWNRNSTYWRLLGILFSASIELWAISRPLYVCDKERRFWRIPVFDSYFGSKTIYEKLIIIKSVILNLAMMITQLVILTEDSKKPVREEIAELVPQIEKVHNEQLKCLANTQLKDIIEISQRDDNHMSRFSNALGKFLAEFEKS